MNTEHRELGPDGELPDALRWQLRALRRDQAPANDLWPGIAARLQPQTAAPVRAPRPRWLAPFAVAATLALAIGFTGVWREPAANDAPQAQAESLLQREAAGMTLQYQAAMQEVQRAAPAQNATAMQPAFDELDRNAALILDALAHDPDSRLLLEQLRRTYARRLALTQRVAYT
ncbi:hypothetical protein LVB77_17355 [Lysobacter sp. 5GHs7-4]|uniref:hypothetical protein n=1 Tax=Lysobacter sp. 5GHs7-4 TaxID=2904253 RepID=UPI001E3FA502|nr:hypothetical protein [Lysobacter sp. 5GHs7-4]UHQ22411.1 hypothetical protein LVB77_17355 [Lysobacter sp. 5GHs7-4]